MTRKPVVLFLWIIGILFPMAWPTRFSALYNRAFEHLFNPLWAHVLMHAFLFAILAYLLARHMTNRVAVTPGRSVVLGVLVAVLVIALLQEGFQLFYKARPAGADEVLDVVIDLAGGSLGVTAWWLSCTMMGHRGLT